ncbi:MAG: hypothetical protein J0M24_18915 [Verrucomicrobia bacterium]|nr:hypothetical protein [Verrucomicrobiota bacterium]
MPVNDTGLNPAKLRQVGRRSPARDGLKAGLALQAVALEFQKAFHHQGPKRGVYRFKTHQDADQWIRQMQARREIPEKLRAER